MSLVLASLPHVRLEYKAHEIPSTAMNLADFKGQAAIVPNNWRGGGFQQR